MGRCAGMVRMGNLPMIAPLRRQADQAMQPAHPLDISHLPVASGIGAHGRQQLVGFGHSSWYQIWSREESLGLR